MEKIVIKLKNVNLILRDSHKYNILTIYHVILSIFLSRS